jgi:UDP-N-acetylglucosamine transferase subunit ALG13
VIFVTVGTNEAPFDRLVGAIDELAPHEEVVVQYGSSALRPVGATCVDFIPFDELLAFVRRARVVVTHAGVGSIMAALSQGKRPIVVPRLSRYREAVDDHQLPFARRLAARGLVTLLEDESQLAAAIGDEHVAVELESTDRSGLAQDLAAYLDSVVRAPRSG